MRKPEFLTSCTATEDGWRLQILEEGLVLSMEAKTKAIIKGHMQKSGFLMTWLNYHHVISILVMRKLNASCFSI